MGLTLTAFGPPELLKDGAPVAPELAWRKHFALLVYLARSPGGTRRREHLVGVLWPDKDEAKARHSLNEACRAVRRGAGEGALKTVADTITFDLTCLTADWDALDRALAAGDVARAAVLWRGEFLEGFGIPDASPFEDWLAVERLGFSSRLRAALTAEAARQLDLGHAAAALALAARVLASDPAAEDALGVAMKAEALAGAAPGALARYDAYTAWLAREHHGVPAPELARLADRVRAGARAPGPFAAVSTTVVATPLVGRGALLERAVALLPRSGGTLTLVALTGDPGCGKSRLLRETAERARLGGIRVATLSCVEADGDVPGGVLAALLRGGLADAPGLAAAAPDALAMLAALDPELAHRYPGAAPRAAPSAAELGRGFGEALAAAAQETPIVLAVDDVHLADDLTIESLPSLLRAAAAAPVALVLAMRRDDLPPALLAVRSRIGHDVPGADIAVLPLEDQSVDQLIGAMLPAYAAEERERLLRRLRRETDGVPLFLVEILRALASGGATAGIWPLAGETTAQPLPFRVPGAVAAALALRVAALEPEVRATLLAAAVQGERVIESQLALLRGLDQQPIEAHLADLERAGFLTHDGANYRFSAGMVRTVLIADMLSGGERRKLHLTAARVLEAANQANPGVGLRIAEHRYAAGEWQEAAETAAAAGRLAEAAGAARLAARAERLRAKAAERAARG